MLSEMSKAREFLKKHKMLADDIDFVECFGDFISEMEEGLNSESSIPMLPTYLSLDNMNIKNERVVVIDAGGTNFRVAQVSFDENGKYQISDFAKHKMPGTYGELISPETFFREMAELVRPLAEKSDKIGFSFSFALEATKQKDGKILFLSKELKVDGGIGMLVGENLLKALRMPDKKVVMLNDTVAVLLAGVATYYQRRFSSYVGFILGTGTNTAYIERNSNIKKDAEISQSSGSMIINMESGSFDKVTKGDADILLNRSTKNPGVWFEKMISGAYQGMNLLFTVKLACEDGLFSKEFTDALNGLSSIEGKDIDEFFMYPYGEGTLSKICQNNEERLLLYAIADNLNERAAKLAAINLAAVVKKSGAGENPLEPACIVAEGSTYYKAKFMKDRILYYLKRYLTDEMQLYAEVLPVEDATLLGSAIAGIIG